MAKNKVITNLAGIFPALLCVLVFSGPAAAVGKPGEITLEKAIEMALAYSPALAQARQDVVAAEFGEKKAFTSYLPTFSTRYSWSHVGETSVSQPTDNQWNFQVGVSQPIFTGFRVTSAHRLAELGVNVAKLQIDLGELDLVSRVKIKYFEFLKTQKDYKVAVETVRQLESQLQNTQDFYEVGILPVNDVLKVKVELANAQQEEVRASNSTELTKSELASLLGLSLDHDLAVKDVLKYEKDPITYKAARDRARVERPELKSLEVQLMQADQNIRQAKSGYYPEVNLRGSYLVNSDEFYLDESGVYQHDNWQVSTTLDWNFWEWNRTKYEVSSQRAARRKLEDVRRELEDKIDLEVKQAYLYLRDTERNIVTAQVAVEQAKENYRITNERFREQLTTNTELLDAQTLLTRAQNSYINTLAIYNQARADLHRAMGLTSIEK